MLMRSGRIVLCNVGSARENIAAGRRLMNTQANSSHHGKNMVENIGWDALIFSHAAVLVKRRSLSAIYAIVERRWRTISVCHLYGCADGWRKYSIQIGAKCADIGHFGGDLRADSGASSCLFHSSIS